MKKEGIFLCLLIILVLSLNIFHIALVDAQSPEDSGLPKEIEEITNKGSDAYATATDAEKRNYYYEELKKLLLENVYIKLMDSAFTKISFLFIIFLGEPYVLSGILFLVLVLWIIFFFKFAEIFRNYSSFSNSVSWGIGLILTVIMAQLKILRKIVEFFLWIVFYKEASWWRLLIAIVIIAGVVLFYTLSSKIGKSQREQRKKKEEEENREKLKNSAATAENFSKTVNDALKNVSGS